MENCEFCLLVTKNLSKCGLCASKSGIFCDRCFRLHIDFHDLEEDILTSVKDKWVKGLENMIDDKTGIL